MVTLTERAYCLNDVRRPLDSWPSIAVWCLKMVAQWADNVSAIVLGALEFALRHVRSFAVFPSYVGGQVPITPGSVEMAFHVTWSLKNQLMGTFGKDYKYQC